MHFGLVFLLLRNFGRIQTIYTAAAQSGLMIGRMTLTGLSNGLLCCASWSTSSPVYGLKAGLG
jgi:hypothetical protein